MRITDVLRTAGTLGPENRHQIQRLIISYIRYDRASIELFTLGTVTETDRNSLQILNIFQSEMRHADSDATTAEMELGITPRRRGAVAKAKRAETTKRQSDRYLKSVS